MLNISATNNKNELDMLNKGIFGQEFDGGVGYVLYAENNPIGVAKLIVNPETATVVRVGILPELRGNGFGDFFTRSLMNVLSGVTKIITIDYIDEYYKKFGFFEENGQMKIKSEDLHFPRACCGEK